jgi:hypothetical protein
VRLAAGWVVERWAFDLVPDVRIVGFHVTRFETPCPRAYRRRWQKSPMLPALIQTYILMPSWACGCVSGADSGRDGGLLRGRHVAADWKFEQRASLRHLAQLSPY